MSDIPAAPVPAPAPALPAAHTLHQGDWLRLCACGRWEYAERTRASGAVVIVALTPADEVLFVEQFRVPVAQWTIEMPAGLVGDEAGARGESALAAAARELEEETGWRPARVGFLHEGPSSAGMSNEQIAFVRAWDLTRTGTGGGDATENIRVHAIARRHAHAWLRACARVGYSIDPKLFAGLWFLEHGA